MDRLACVEIPAIALQLLLRAHPERAEGPAAVVDRDKPQGIILEVNRRAREQGVRPGMRYAAGLSLAATLTAGEVDAAALAAGEAELVAALRALSPEVEPSDAHPGVFFMDASGLGLLYPSLEEWAARVREATRRLGFAARVAVGFSRLGSWAAARGKRGLTVFETAAAEDEALRAAPLSRLPLPPPSLMALERLGVRTVGAFLELPPGGVGRRFGAEAHRLHRMARGTLTPPLQGSHPQEPLRECILLDDGETDVSRLLFLIKRGVDDLIRGADSRGQLLSQLSMLLVPERGDELDEALRPAAPTADVVELMNLVRLRLEALALPSGIIEIHLSCEAVKAGIAQQELFASRPRRAPEAANRAFARLRAELGEDAVSVARLKDGHLPEARFEWARMDALPPARPGPPGVRPLVRRLFPKPIPLAHRPRVEPDGWMVRGFADGDVVRLSEPQIVSGGWWATPVHRAYHFAEMRGGALLWIFYDQRRRRWFLHGQVE